MSSVAEYLLTWTHGIVGQAHLVLALIALGSGSIVAAFRKGTRFHGALGYLYLASMIGLNISALMKYDLTGGPNMFHAFALGSLATVCAGYVAVLLLKRGGSTETGRAHGTFMIWSYFGLFSALIAEIVTRSFPYMLHGDGGWTRFTIALVAFMAVTAFVTHRFIQSEVERTFGMNPRGKRRFMLPLSRDN